MVSSLLMGRAWLVSGAAIGVVLAAEGIDQRQLGAMLAVTGVSFGGAWLARRRTRTAAPIALVIGAMLARTVKRYSTRRPGQQPLLPETD